MLKMGVISTSLPVNQNTKLWNQRNEKIKMSAAVLVLSLILLIMFNYDKKPCKVNFCHCINFFNHDQFISKLQTLCYQLWLGFSVVTTWLHDNTEGKGYQLVLGSL